MTCKDDKITGLQKAATNKPITLALIPLKARIIISIFLNSCHIGKIPITSKKDGKKIKNKQTKLIRKTLNSFLKKMPKKDENVNNGPGIA